MLPLYGDKCFTRPETDVWCKKFAHGRESVVDGQCVVLTTFAAFSVRACHQKNLQGNCVESTNQHSVPKPKVYQVVSYADLETSTYGRHFTFPSPNF